MSHQNVEIVRRGFDAIHTFEPEVYLPYFAEDCVFHPLPDWPDGPSAVTGHRGIVAGVSIWRESFDDYSAELREVRDAGGSVVCRGEQTGKIKGTDAKLKQQFVFVCSDFRDGSVGEMRFFRSWQEALEAAGLSE
jgi:ketosteroid isomerase-like protein